jgi:hypothetical protein
LLGAAARHFRRENPEQPEAGMRIVRVLVLAAMLPCAAVPGAAAQSAVGACHGAQQRRDVAELLFGRDIGKRLGVSEAAWQRFVAREITPRFPEGLTVIDAGGQWRDPGSGRIVREPSKRVEIVLPGDSDDAARLDAVVSAYKRQFRQRSVGLIVQSACVSF